MTEPCEAKPQAEHAWLMQLVGEWTYEADCTMSPDEPSQQFTGKQSIRSLGGMWLLCEGEGEMPDGGTATSLITLGYDPTQQKYVGSFICSVMHRLWIYEGSRDATGKILPLDTTGPNFSGDGTMSKYQDIIEIHSPDHYTMSSQMLGSDGTWVKFMTAEYRRKT